MSSNVVGAQQSEAQMRAREQVDADLEACRQLDPGDLSHGDRHLLVKLGVFTVQEAFGEGYYLDTDGVLVQRVGAETFEDIDAAIREASASQ
jgi:hypothetical protein